jgi:hypothetical protein
MSQSKISDVLFQTFGGSGATNQTQANVNFEFTTGMNTSGNYGIVQQTTTTPYTTTTPNVWPTTMQVNLPVAAPEPEACDRFVARNRRAKQKVCKHCEQPYEDHAAYTREILLKLRASLD